MDAMMLTDFERLPETEQLDVLYEKGVYIGKRKSGKRNVLLYQLDSYYVEIVYLVHRCHVIQVRCSASTDLLDPYLEQIEIEIVV
ncbi:MAG TPA: hypothetical protein VHK69_22505 [Chitinophagaceae bacterium]|jgi:hypothetical protein|nr:hypothetical protein [Chitinophagaceae bacterium]